MFKECQNSKVLMFPKKSACIDKGSVIIAAQENGDVRIDVEGLSPREIRSVLCVAIKASYEFDENISA